MVDYMLRLHLSLCVSCGDCEALICGKQFHGPPWKGSVKPPV